MIQNFKSRFWKYLKPFALLYLVLFFSRLIYGYFSTDINTGNDFYSDYFSSIENLRKNYASEKSALKKDVLVQSNLASNQKFEKIASLKTKSSQFEKDEKKLKEEVKSFNAIIQYEQNLGQKGNRQLHLLIGVSPNLFDSFYASVQKIGIVKAKEITKVDKTNEYRRLNAQRISIENTLKSLHELKSKNGPISDFVSLNEKILEVEEKLQELGVELGNFDAENEFCTIKLSLYEGISTQNISFLHRIKVAFEWSIKYYGLIILIMFGLSATIFITILIVDKLKKIITL